MKVNENVYVLITHFLEPNQSCKIVFFNKPSEAESGKSIFRE